MYKHSVRFVINYWIVENEKYLSTSATVSEQFCYCSDRDCKYIYRYGLGMVIDNTFVILVYSRHLSRFFDCLAYPNLSATLANDQN